jgi:hypothetical protein
MSGEGDGKTKAAQQKTPANQGFQIERRAGFKK